MEKQKWINNGGVYYPIPGYSTIYSSPGSGIFQIVHDQETGRLGLGKISDTFEFDFKIYDLGCDDIFDRVITTWFSEPFVKANKNLGVIFNGLKGTGKTIAAKLLSNRIGLPVIVISKPVPHLIEFIQSLCFECTVLIDEAEKTFEDEPETLLKMIDGVYNSSRKLYLLTTNKLTLDENLIGRPGRIRYIKQFGILPLNAVNDYIDDCLVDKSLRGKVVSLVDRLAISTIDVLKAVVEEANIYGDIPDEKMLNLPITGRRLTVYRFTEVDGGCIEDLKTFILSHIGPGERVADWLGHQVKGKFPSFDNISLVEDEFNCDIRKRNVIRIGDCIKDSTFDDGDIILCEPDEHGFFEVLDDCENAPQLCCISKDYGVHSIYKGKLKS